MCEWYHEPGMIIFIVGAIVFIALAIYIEIAECRARKLMWSRLADLAKEELAAYSLALKTHNGLRKRRKKVMPPKRRKPVRLKRAQRCSQVALARAQAFSH